MAVATACMTALLVYAGTTTLLKASMASLQLKSPTTVWDFSPKHVPVEQEPIQELYSLHIPKVNVHSAVAVAPFSLWQSQNWPYLEQVMQEAMQISGAVAYPHSVLPGQVGSVFITAHSSPPDSSVPETKQTTLFERLPELNRGDQLHVQQGSTVYTYQVVSFKIIAPEEIEAVKQSYERPELVLITCYPIGSTKDRFVVRAKLVATEEF